VTRRSGTFFRFVGSDPKRLSCNVSLSSGDGLSETSRLMGIEAARDKVQKPCGHQGNGAGAPSVPVSRNRTSGSQMEQTAGHCALAIKRPQRFQGEANRGRAPDWKHTPAGALNAPAVPVPAIPAEPFTSSPVVACECETGC
jgi:hypothetical protein